MGTLRCHAVMSIAGTLRVHRVFAGYPVMSEDVVKRQVNRQVTTLTTMPNDFDDFTMFEGIPFSSLPGSSRASPVPQVNLESLVLASKMQEILDNQSQMLYQMKLEMQSQMQSQMQSHLQQKQEILDNQSQMQQKLQKELQQAHRKIGGMNRELKKLKKLAGRVESLEQQCVASAGNQTGILNTFGMQYKFTCHKCASYTAKKRSTLIRHQKGCTKQRGRKKRNSKVTPVYVCAKCAYTTNNRALGSAHNCVGEK